MHGKAAAAKTIMLIFFALITLTIVAFQIYFPSTVLSLIKSNDETIPEPHIIRILSPSLPPNRPTQTLFSKQMQILTSKPPDHSQHFDKFHPELEICSSPVIVGGNAAAGTRGAAHLLLRMGVNIIADNSYTLDTEVGDWPDLVRQVLVHTNGSLNYRLEDIDPVAVESVTASLLKYFSFLKNISCLHAKRNDQYLPLWGFKVPASIFFLPFWNRIFPNFIFVHVIRDGRDGPFGNQGDLVKHFWDIFPNDSETRHFESSQRIAISKKMAEKDAAFIKLKRTVMKVPMPVGANVGNIYVSDLAKVQDFYADEFGRNMTRWSVKLWSKVNMEANTFGQAFLGPHRYHLVRSNDLVSPEGFFYEAYNLFPIAYRQNTVSNSDSDKITEDLISTVRRVHEEYNDDVLSRKTLSSFVYNQFLKASHYNDKTAYFCCISSFADGRRFSYGDWIAFAPTPMKVAMTLEAHTALVHFQFENPDFSRVDFSNYKSVKPDDDIILLKQMCPGGNLKAYCNTGIINDLQKPLPGSFTGTSNRGIIKSCKFTQGFVNASLVQKGGIISLYSLRARIYAPELMTPQLCCAACMNFQPLCTHFDIIGQSECQLKHIDSIETKVSGYMHEGIIMYIMSRTM